MAHARWEKLACPTPKTPTKQFQATHSPNDVRSGNKSLRIVKSKIKIDPVTVVVTPRKSDKTEPSIQTKSADNTRPNTNRKQSFGELPSIPNGVKIKNRQGSEFSSVLNHIRATSKTPRIQE